MLHVSWSQLGLWNTFMGILIQSLCQNIIYNANIIVCSIISTNYRKHSHPLFIRCNLTTVHVIYEIEVGKWMYNCMYIHWSLPLSLLDIFIFNYYIHSYRTRKTYNVRIIINKCERSIREGPIIWNVYKNTPNFNRFTLSLKATG